MNQGPATAGAAAAHGIQREVVRLLVTRRGFVLLPRCWVVRVGSSFARLSRFRRLARDNERPPATPAGTHHLASALRMPRRAVAVPAGP